MNPARKLLETFPDCDFALFHHGWAPHGRDYFFHIQDCLGADPGEFIWTFTHCVVVNCHTRVRDDVWPESWDDVFTDYERWKENESQGYVWGSNWSNAYPGLTIVEDSKEAVEWSRRLGKDFYEIQLETDRFFIQIIFHGLNVRKINGNTDTIGSVIIPADT